MRQRLFLALTTIGVLAQGCAASTDDGAAGTGTEDVTTFVADSTYTSVTDGCEVVYEDDESDAMEMQCAGVGPYGLRVWSGDLRMRATLTTSESAFEIPIPEETPHGAAWNTVGPKAEWRTKRGGALPYAVILRHVFDTDPENASAPRQHYLAVVRIVGPEACLAGFVEASRNSANANALARQIADDARTKGCPKKVTITEK